MSPDLSVPAGMVAYRFRAMGTSVVALLPDDRAAVAGGAVEDLFAEWEAVLSRFLPESELSRLNERAGTTVEVSALLLSVVEAAVEAARETRGLFDPGLHDHLVRIGYDRPFEQLQSVVAVGPGECRGGGGRAIAVDPNESTVRLPPGLALDLGGIAKGMAVDAALLLLGQLGIACALVCAGGDLAIAGSPPGASSWPVLVGDDPAGPVVRLARGALATSGTSRRSWLQGTIPRHHLIDPRTGEPAASGLVQVSVAAPTCRAAEVAATAVFVAGPRIGSWLLERRGLAGLLVTTSGRRLAVGGWPSPDLAAVA